MPPIDGVSSSVAGALQVQPRPPQPPAQNRTEAGSNGPSAQQYVQTAQQAGQSQGVQPQTATAVSQPAATQQSQPNNRPAANDSSASVQTITQFLDQLSNIGSDRQQPANQPVTSQPATSQNSALNYTAGGTANPVQSPTDAGRRLSLSV